MTEHSGAVGQTVVDGVPGEHGRRTDPAGADLREPDRRAVVGVFVGGWLFGLVNVRIGTGLLAVFVEAVAGAAVLMVCMGFLKQRRG